MVQAANFAMGTKLSISAAYHFPGYIGAAALGIGLVGTIGTSVFEHYVAYETCTKIKKKWAKNGSK